MLKFHAYPTRLWKFPVAKFIQLFQFQEEEEDLTNRDDDEEPSKRSELSDKVKVTAVVEFEPNVITNVASEDEPQSLQVTDSKYLVFKFQKSIHNLKGLIHLFVFVIQPTH